MQGVSGALSLAAMVALEESGFVVLPGPFVVDQLGMVGCFEKDAGRLEGNWPVVHC